MPPLHRLDFALQAPVVNPRFVPSNNLPHKLDRVRLKEIYKFLRCSDASRTIVICQIPCILQTPSTSSDDHRLWFSRFHMTFALFSRYPVLLFSCHL